MRSFSSMMRAGDFMSTFGSPTDVNVVFGADAAGSRCVLLNADADVMKSSLLASWKTM
jgi:hypothetical protein